MKGFGRLSFPTFLLFTTARRRIICRSVTADYSSLSIISVTTSTNTRSSSSFSIKSTKNNMTPEPWTAGDSEQAQQAATQLDIWPLDEYNAALLNEVHPRGYVKSVETPHEEYDIIAIGSGAGGLVASKQSARRGAKSALISAHLAGGDCLNVGCVPVSCMTDDANSNNNSKSFFLYSTSLTNVSPPSFV
jgi:hypothetical protein